MRELRYTLRSDGSSDESLLPLLTWLLRQHGINCAIQAKWADLRSLRYQPKRMSVDEIQTVLELFPCDLLFIHRDAEKEAREKRIREIQGVVAEVIERMPMPPAVCVIPVRMQEAWLLFNEAAIRRAAGNPNGKHFLEIPSLDRVEDLPEPKNDLHNLLRDASGLQGRKLRKFKTDAAARRVTQFVNDFSPLRKLSAFIALETEIKQVIAERGWQS